MTARSFTVETRAQAALIVGSDSHLEKEVIRELAGLGLQAIKVENLAQVEKSDASYDLDYLLLFLDEPTNAWLAREGRELVAHLQTRIQSGETRLILVHHTGFLLSALPLDPPTRELIFTDYLGEREIVAPILNQWVTTVEKEHLLVIPGDGLEEESLIGEKDLARGIALASIHPGNLGEKIFLGNPETISFSSLAYNLRSHVPYKIDVTFAPGELPGEPPDTSLLEKTNARLGLELAENVPLLLKKYIEHHLATRSVVKEAREPAIKEQVVEEPRPQKIHAAPPKPVEIELPAKKLTPLQGVLPVFVPLQTRRSRHVFPWKKLALPKLSLEKRSPATPPSLAGILGKGIMIALALYLGSLAFALTVSALSLKNIVASVRTGTVPKVNRFTQLTGTYLEANWVVASSLPLISSNEWVASGTTMLSAYNQSLRVFATAGSLSTTTQELTHYIVGSGSGDIASTISQSRLQVEELYQELALLYGSLPEERPLIIPGRYSNAYKAGRETLGELKHSVVTTKALLATLPDVIGLGGRKKYGVLFQNNMELRATGGFIGSFAILSFENGKLYDMPVFDVYAADGQLKGHVEPPKPIKDILGEANWYLRDSNFDPDFPTSARRAEWFIKKTLNQDLDGTIAVNVDSLKNLLSAVGPLEIPDYNETITADNLYERTQFHAEVNFFPGSSQKKEFLSTVGNALFAKLPTMGVGEGLKIVAGLTKSIEEKNTLISVVDPAAERIFATLNWNGQVTDLPCPTNDICQKDYLMVVDSNFGVNKANYFVKRSILQMITLDKDLKVGHTLRLRYQNTSTSSAWPAGQYKNYQRLYLPPGTLLGSIKVGEHELSPSEYTVASEHNKLIVAYLATVPINSTLEVIVSYETPALSKDQLPLYTWYWQKQPGTGDGDALAVVLNYPLYLKPLIISPQGELTPQQLKFGLKNDTDHRVTVKFSQ